MQEGNNSILTIDETHFAFSKTKLWNNKMTSANNDLAGSLTAQIHTITWTVNNRIFSPDSPPWSTLFSDAFTAQTGVLTAAGAGDNLSTFLAGLSHLCEENPTFQHVVKEVRVVVNSKKTRAECLLNVDFVGLPEGIVRPGVATVEWRVEDGEWKCVRWESLRGLGGDGDMEGF